MKIEANLTPKAEMSTSKRKYVWRYARYDERDLIAQLFVENLWNIAHLPPDMDTVCTSICTALHQGRVLVVECSEGIAAVASFVQGTYWYSPQPCLFDTGIFVLPKYRKTLAGSAIWTALRAAAKERNALLIVGAGTTDPEAGKIMAKRYKQIGAAYLVT